MVENNDIEKMWLPLSIHGGGV